MSEEARRAAGLGIIPVALLVHNAEEAIAIPAMLTVAQAKLTSILGPGYRLPSSHAYLVALIVITVVAFVLWLTAHVWQGLAYVLVVLQATMAVNVVSHLGGAVALRGYAPGVVTAVLVEGVASVVVYRQLRRKRWMSRTQWVLLPIFAVLLHGPVAFFLAAVVLRT